MRFAPRTWGHGGMSGASKGAWLHGMFELWFEEALHPAGRRCRQVFYCVKLYSKSAPSNSIFEAGQVQGKGRPQWGGCPPRSLP